jgi:nucleoid-associated protein YgaU
MARFTILVAVVLLTGCASAPPEPEINPLPPGHPMTQAGPEPGKVWAKPAPPSQSRGHMAPIGEQEREQEQIYTVQQGDTLWRISKRHGTSVAELMKLNGLTETDVRNLRVGQVLRVE